MRSSTERIFDTLKTELVNADTVVRLLAGFPEPAARTVLGDTWLRSDVEAWLEAAAKKPSQREQLLNKVRKTAPGRDKAEAVHRIALFLEDDSDDQKLLIEISEFLLDVRQALRGGRRRTKGSRHWDMED